jgi:hypothetical protein
MLGWFNCLTGYFRYELIRNNCFSFMLTESIDPHFEPLKRLHLRVVKHGIVDDPSPLRFALPFFFRRWE